MQVSIPQLELRITTTPKLLESGMSRMVKLSNLSLFLG